MESWINSMTLRESTMFVYTQNFNQNYHSSCKHYCDCNFQPFWTIMHAQRGLFQLHKVYTATDIASSKLHLQTEVNYKPCSL